VRNFPVIKAYQERESPLYHPYAFRLAYSETQPVAPWRLVPEKTDRRKGGYQPPRRHHERHERR
jgi:hypothetical protein